MGKATFILIIGSLALFSIYVSNMNNYVLRGSEVMFDRYSEIQAKQLASSVINMLLTELADSSSLRTDDTESISILDGSAEYRIVDTILLNTDSLILIDVTATFAEQTYSVKAFTATLEGWVPPSVRGSWTANADLNNTISDMYIDGRDYNLDGTINVGEGTYAVSSATTFTNVDGAEIGGTTINDVDIATTADEALWSQVIEQNVIWGTSFPSTPDEILGYAEGTLISIAQSGEGGSQYILDPGDKIDGGDMSFPLRGVTYVDITDGIEAKFKFTDVAGEIDEGILILHGPGASSRVKEVARSDKESTIPFHGLFIADYSFHHHIDVIGAVLQLSPDLEQLSNCNGNADHFVHYSSESIEQATKFVADQTGTAGGSGSEDLIGVGRKKLLFWYE